MSDLSIRPYFPFCRVRIARQSVDDSTGWIEAEPDRRFHPVCQACGQPARRTQRWDVRTVRDLNFGQHRMFVNCRYRLIFCDRCDGYHVEDLGLFDAGRRVTRRLARTIYNLCRTMTVTDVARHYGLDWKTVKAIDKAYLQDYFLRPSLDDLKLLAVDEIAVRRGHTYMTVVLNYVTGEVLWMGEGRSVDTLKDFFKLMSPRQKASIEAVAMDMWKPFIRAVGDALPGARIVHDLFHVVKMFNKVIDRVRLDEYRRAGAEDKAVYKGSKYLLLSNFENLDTQDKRDRLKRLLSLNETLSQTMILKDLLKELWTYRDRAPAERALARWCELARAVGHPAVRRFADTLEAHREGILNHCDYPIHTSKLEGVNNKIKVIKRTAYGYRDQHYFSLKVIQAFSTN